MLYQWTFRAYRRRFKQAVQTSHGIWAVREGILLRLVDEAGAIGWGEIAPIPWFGSETLGQALAFCHQLPSTLTNDVIFAIPDSLPCCQFGFESAWESIRANAINKRTIDRFKSAQNQASLVIDHSALQPQHSPVRPQHSVVAVLSSAVEAQRSVLQPQKSNVAVPSSTYRPQSSVIVGQNSTPQLQHSILKPLPTPHSPLPIPHSLSSALLPAGNAALHAWRPLWEMGFRTFKWKIGVGAIAIELELLRLLTQSLPAAAKLRLDANGGLSLREATQWLEICDAIAADPTPSIAIEYIEQPLCVSQFQAMRNLSEHYRTSIALDESVATLQQLQTCYENGWRGIFVLKPAIVGSPTRLRQFCQECPLDAVFSSAFETAIGRQAGLRLAADLSNPDRAIGYGTTHWFDDADPQNFEQLWQSHDSD